MFTSVLARRLVLGAGVALLAACASGGGGATSGETASRTGGDRFTLTAADIATAQSNNLYDVIEKLRPQFLRPQGGQNFRAAPGFGTPKPKGAPTPAATATTANGMPDVPVPIRVYQNDQPLGGVDDLRQIPISSVVEVKFVQGPQAAVRYGTNHSNGAILVRTR